jgi:hypothetical protein
VKHDPRICQAVLRGYLNLALFLGIIAVGLVPIVFHPGARGIRIALIALGTLGLVTAVGRRLAGQGSWAFTLAFGTWSAAQIALAFFVSPGNDSGDAVKQLLILFSLSLMFIVIPKIIVNQRNRMK